MTEGPIGPITNSERIEVVDVLRGLAICGILIGNLQWFSGYGMMPLALQEQAPMIDRIVQYLVHVFIEGKFYSIFSLLFGFGFALQIHRAEQRGDDKASVFKRRLLWLLVIGLMHAFLLWAGDILSVYALTGFILLLFRKKSNDSLLKWAFWLFVVPIITASIMLVLFLLFAPPDVGASIKAAQADSWTSGVRTVLDGSYFDIISGYNINYIIGRWVGLIVQMRFPKILATFLVGLYAYRIGVFQNPQDHKPLIRKLLIYGLGFGIVANIIFAALSKSEADLPPSIPGLGGVVMYAFGVPALALGISALIVTLWQNAAWKRLLGWLAPVGRMALTNYLLQTVICVFIFYGYGFGLFGSFGAAKATLTAFGIYAFQITLSAVWLKFFAYGPMEWVWRQLTYGNRISLRNSVSTATLPSGD